MYLTAWNLLVSNAVGIGAQGNGTNTDIPATAIADVNKLFFDCDPRVLCLLPASMNLLTCT